MTKILSNKSNIDLDYPICRPSLDLDFTQEELDPRITFSRGSIGTRVNRNRLIETVSANQPRFDFDPISGECRGLLIEESRTNSLLYSQDFSNAIWSSNLTILLASYNNLTGLDGTTSASTFTAIPLSGLNTIYQNFTCTASTTYTFSFYVKLGTLPSSSFKIAVFNLTGSSFIAVDVVPTQTLSTSSWTRVSYTFTTPVGCISARVYPYRNAVISQNNGTFYLWGAQVEAGAFPTSYIPTTASTVTRSADNADMTGTNFSSWYNSSEGTIQTNIAIPYRSVTGGRSFALDNGTVAYMLDFTNTSNVVAVEGLENSGYRVMTQVSNSTSIKLNQTTTYSTQPAPSQIICVNGTLSGASKVYLTTSNYANLRLGTQVNGAAYLNGTISRLTYYPRALKPNQLQFLTQ